MIKYLIILLLSPIYVISQDTTHIKYNIQGTGLYNQGNNNNIIVNSNNNLTVDKKNIKNSTIYNYAYGIQTNVVNQNEHFFNNSLSYKLNKKLRAVSLIELERSFMRLIDVRGVYGIGIGYTLNKYISISDLFLVDDTQYGDGSRLIINRNSLRLRINYTKNRFTFNTETYVQPDIKMSYFKFRSTTSIGYKVTKLLSFIISSQDSYEQFVIKNKQHNDFNLSIGISISNL